MLVQAGEQQQVLDEQPHPARLVLDAGHRLVQVRFGDGCTLPVRLGDGRLDLRGR